MPKVDLFRGSEYFFFSQIYWVLRVLMILSVWINNHGVLEGYEMKNGGEKMRTHVRKAMG